MIKFFLEGYLNSFLRTRTKPRVAPTDWAEFALVSGIILNIIGFTINFIGVGLVVGVLACFFINSYIIAGLVGGIVAGILFFFKKKEEKAEIEIKVGHMGIITIMGEIFGREEKISTKEGRFKRVPSIPFFGEIFSIQSQPMFYDNIDIDFENVPTKDGQLMKGKLSVEVEMVDPYMTFELNQSTKESFIGRIKEKTLEVINKTFESLNIEKIMIDERADDGVSIVREKFDGVLEKMKTGRHDCFEEPADELFHKDREHNADVYFPDAGVNLKFILKTHIPMDTELIKTYSDINKSQAKKRQAKAEAEVTEINARAEAKKIKIEGKANIAVKKQDFEMMQNQFKDLVTEQLTQQDVSRTTAEHNARLLLNLYSNEELISMSNSDGTPIESEVSKIVGAILHNMKN